MPSSAPDGRAALPSPGLQGNGLHLAYSHQLTLGVPEGHVRAHFTAARDRCLNDAALRCVLMDASLHNVDAVTPRGDESESGDLELRLPHEAIGTFVNALSQPLEDETAGTVAVTSQATTAEDLGQPIADSERRHAQLTDYRDRLHELESRHDIKVDDLIKIAGQISDVQSQLEAADAQQRDLAQRVNTEKLSVNFHGPARSGGSFGPVSSVWKNAADILGDSVASALEFSITALPWLPLVGLGLLILRAARWLIFRPRRLTPAPGLST